MTTYLLVLSPVLYLVGWLTAKLIVLALILYGWDSVFL